MSRNISRRDFLKATCATAALVALGGCAAKAKITGGSNIHFAPPKDIVDKLVIATGNDVESKITEAIGKLGGIEQFIRKGDKVVLKPNAAWARQPGEGATTNPAVIKEVISLCRKAGASQVIVLEHTIDRPAAMVLAMTGIGAAAQKAGAKLILASDESTYRDIAVPKGKLLKEDKIPQALLDADVFISMPVAKNHCETKLSLGMKNLMGIIYNRQAWHQSGVHQCIADFATAVKPTLTILDATTMLLDNGPKGPGKTKKENKIVFGVDQVAVDAFGATLFGFDPKDIEHIALADRIGAGTMNLDSLQIIKV